MLRIALDGPAAAGKSTVGQALARALGCLYLDTGAMYRAVTWLTLHTGLDVADEEAVTTLAQRARFDFPGFETNDQVNPPLIINGIDATAGLRTHEVDATVSLISRYQGVRAAMVTKQRELARAHPVVMVGRDIGTVVLPDADVKIFLTASAEERARRRASEMAARGDHVDPAAVLEGVRRRDRLDSERQYSPLRPADDAIILDTTGMEAPEVVEIIRAQITEQTMRARA